MTLCTEQQHSIGNRLIEIYKICKTSREECHMTDQEFVMVAKNIREAEICKKLEHKMEVKP